MTTSRLEPAQRVRILQTVHTREGDWQTEIEGRIVSIASKPTGSWFAHGKNDKLWLERLTICKDDGELAELVLDRDSVVTILNNSPDDA